MDGPDASCSDGQPHGVAINQAYSKINEINTHLVATDLRVTVLEQHRDAQ
jgi:hypothetical protein